MVQKGVHLVEEEKSSNSSKTFGNIGWYTWFVFGLLLTLALGIWLRWSLSGLSLPSFLAFRHLKHAHSHLGYYAVLFPLVWAMWYQRDGFFLSGWMWVLYGVGIVLSVVGFLRAGYCLESIVGSSLVGAIWLVSAWKQRRVVLGPRQWLAAVPIGIFLASLCVPPIAVMTRRQPILALQLVQTFLSLLLFLVALPSILERFRLVAPPNLYWLFCGVAGALFLGVVPHPALGLGLVGMALWIQYTMIQQKGMPVALHLLWSLWTIGTAAVGLHLVPNEHRVAVAGLHLTLLGPFFLGAIHLFVVPSFPAWWLWSFVCTLLVMVGAIVAPLYISWPWFSQISAVSGTLLGVLVVIAVWKTVTHRHRLRF